jgi:hypothetical protein
VRSYRTFSPLPRGASPHPRRYVFCGTFPGVTPGRRYRPPCPAEPGLSSPPALRREQRPPGPLRPFTGYSSPSRSSTLGRQISVPSALILDHEQVRQNTQVSGCRQRHQNPWAAGLDSRQPRSHIVIEVCPTTSPMGYAVRVSKWVTGRGLIAPRPWEVPNGDHRDFPADG